MAGQLVSIWSVGVEEGQKGSSEDAAIPTKLPVKLGTYERAQCRASDQYTCTKHERTRDNFYFQSEWNKRARRTYHAAGKAERPRLTVELTADVFRNILQKRKKKRVAYRELFVVPRYRCGRKCEEPLVFILTPL